MSHFTVLVVTADPSDEAITKALAPFHEYECTGVDDEYVYDVDVTDEAKKALAEYTYTRWVDADGIRHDPYKARFYREPVKEDGLGRGPHGLGSNGKVSWDSRDWGDGKGYRTKVHMTAEEVGMTAIEVPVADVKSIAEWAEDYGGWELRDDGRFYKHTNPNAKWDWWKIGGRWEGHLKLKSGAAANQARKSEVDIASYENDDLVTFAVLVDGEWKERGRMGWFACVSDEKDDWSSEFMNILDSIPEDKFLTVVDCHI